MFEKFQGFGYSVGRGSKPAVLVIDFINAFTDPTSLLGADFTPEVQATKQLIETARVNNVPVIYTTVAYEKNYIDAGLFITKVPAMDILVENTAAVEVDSRIARDEENEVLITKKYASSFFGTSLSSILAVQGIDTLLLTGATTSGCVRATAVDGLQYGYRTVVVEDCVGDRSQSAHEASLYDINTKYGDVDSLENIIEYIQQLNQVKEGV